MNAIGKLKMQAFDIDVQNRILVCGTCFCVARPPPNIGEHRKGFDARLVKAILEQNSIVAEVHPDVLLVDIGLTSMDMVSLMLGVEAEFDFTIPQSEITPENFQSIATLERMIVGQLQGAPAA